MRTLESLVSHPGIRDIDPTTKRLVDRCLSGDWCVQLRKVESPTTASDGSFSPRRVDSPGMDSVTSGSKSDFITSSPEIRPRRDRAHSYSLKTSRSFENMRPGHTSRGSKSGVHAGDLGQGRAGAVSTLNLSNMGAALPLPISPGMVSPQSPGTPGTPVTPSTPVRASTLPEQLLASGSSTSLAPSVSSLDQLAGASAPTVDGSPGRPGRRTSITRVHSDTRIGPDHANAHGGRTNGSRSLGQAVDSIVTPTPVSSAHRPAGSYESQSLPVTGSRTEKKPHRSAPPTPPKRRKPPAVPGHASTQSRTVSRSAAGAMRITTIASSTSSSTPSSGRTSSSPLSRVYPVMPS